jgi:hypothetical protein
LQSKKNGWIGKFNVFSMVNRAPKRHNAREEIRVLKEGFLYEDREHCGSYPGDGAFICDCPKIWQRVGPQAKSGHQRDIRAKRAIWRSIGSSGGSGNTTVNAFPEPSADKYKR